MWHSSSAIANEFLRRAQDEGKALTHMHLQKLVYVAHGFHLALHGEPLIDEQFQAWDIGPIAPELYSALKRYGAGPVTRLIRRTDEPFYRHDTGWSGDGLQEAASGGAIVEPLSDTEREVVDLIWQEFRPYEAFQLSALTTHGARSPWARFHKPGGREPIPNNSIRDYFAEFVEYDHDAAQG